MKPAQSLWSLVFQVSQMTDLSALLSDPLPDPLTQRELDILSLMAENLSNREIGAALHLAETTVKWHNTQIFEKLAVKTRREAVTRCDALGLLTTRDETREDAKHNLPWQTTLFVGRHQEMSDLVRLLIDPDVRLITILGTGGMGKTRLALEIAHAQLDHFADGVYLVALAPLRSTEQIISAIAEVIRFRFYGGSDEKAQLLSFLGNKRMLLVLDSFEYLLDGAGFVTELLQAAPGITVLATSREKLALRCETVYAIGGMAYPGVDALEGARQCSAVELFIRSAERAWSDFELCDDDLRHVACICRLVEGMPLGILLAAAWVDALSLEEIVDEISQGLDLLQVELRDMPAHQRSVRATFDRSWQRLSAVEQDAFMRLAVFRGGGSRAAVQAVTGASLSLLQALMNKSLLWRAPDGRYSTHELLRQYADEQLEIAGEITTACDAHSRFYLRFLADREMDLKGRRQLAALDEVERDFENVRTAWQQALAQKDYDAIGLAAESLLWFSMIRGRYQEGKTLLQRAADEFAPGPGDEPHPVWGKVMARRAWMSAWSISGAPTDDLDKIRACSEQCLQVAERSGSPAERAFCLGLLGLLAYDAGDFTAALPLFAESLDFYCDVDDAFHQARMLSMLAFTLGKMGPSHLEEAIQYTRRSLEIKRAIGDRYGCAEAHEQLGHQLRYLSWENASTVDSDEPERHFHEAIAIASELGNTWTIISSKIGLTGRAWDSGDVQTAKIHTEEAYELARQHHIPMGLGWSLMNLSGLASFEGDIAACHRYLQEARTYFLQDAEGVAWAERDLAYTTCVLRDFGAARKHFHAAVTYWATKTHHPRFLANSLVVAASILAHGGQPERAAMLLGLREAQWTVLLGRPPRQKYPDPLLDRLCNELNVQLGADRYVTAFESGRTLDFDATIKNLLAEFGEQAIQHVTGT